jgi:hypothetical protein
MPVREPAGSIVGQPRLAAGQTVLVVHGWARPRFLIDLSSGRDGVPMKSASRRLEAADVLEDRYVSRPILQVA